MDTVPFIDESCVILIDGSLTVEPFKCGDVDGSSTLNVADLTYLIDFLFRGGPTPPCLAEADINGSGGAPNVADLTYFVDFLFRGGPNPALCP